MYIKSTAFNTFSTIASLTSEAKVMLAINDIDAKEL